MECGFLVCGWRLINEVRNYVEKLRHHSSERSLNLWSTHIPRSAISRQIPAIITDLPAINLETPAINSKTPAIHDSTMKVIHNPGKPRQLNRAAGFSITLLTSFYKLQTVLEQHSLVLYQLNLQRQWQSKQIRSLELIRISQKYLLKCSPR